MKYRYEVVGVDETNKGITREISSSEKLNVGQIVFVDYSFWEIVEAIQDEGNN